MTSTSVHNRNTVIPKLFLVNRSMIINCDILIKKINYSLNSLKNKFIVNHDRRVRYLTYSIIEKRLFILIAECENWKKCSYDYFLIRLTIKLDGVLYDIYQRNLLCPINKNLSRVIEIERIYCWMRLNYIYKFIHHGISVRYDLIQTYISLRHYIRVYKSAYSC